MLGVNLVNKLVKSVDEQKVVKTWFKTGETALLQMNDKSQRFDCLVLKDGKVIESYTLRPEAKNGAPFLKLVTWFCNKLEPLLMEGHSAKKLVSELIQKSI